ncbi:MAG: hypothetical protein JSW04_05785 [Desulfobacterales bacterium]|nr:MAG: hypothetical protein JSW04_05785 [Desulfobacterales bacterium]
MLESYFHYRTDLAKAHCLLQCPETCDAPGCWSSDIIVEVTAFDLIGLSQVLDMPVSSLFFNYCCVGIQGLEFNPRYKRLLLKLAKPCHFLHKTSCTVHDSKPLNCVLFPEYHQINNLLSTFTKHSIFSKVPCLQGDIIISSERRVALKKLRRIGRIEKAVSCYFLFGSPSFIIDSKPLHRELIKDHPKKRSISAREYERLVIKKLKGIGLYNLIMDSVVELDTHRGIESIFNTLDQDDFVTSLLEQVIKPETIYTFKEDRIKQLRRKLGPQAVTLMLF